MNNSNWLDLGQRLTEKEDRLIIWLCATENVWGSGQIIVEPN